MLHQFTFNNYRSFRDETTLDLLAAPIKERNFDVVEDAFGERVLKIAAIYGANGAGKSNVVSAFQEMRKMILSPVSLVNVAPHWFKEDQPTSFDVLLSSGEDIFQYGFSMLKEVIQEEYLFKRKRQKTEGYQMLFQRDQSGIKSKVIPKTTVNVLTDLVTGKTLLLSMLPNLNIKEISGVYEWFQQTEVVDYGSGDAELFTKSGFLTKGEHDDLLALIEDEAELKDLMRFIQAIDVGIEQFLVKDVVMDNLPDMKLIMTLHRDQQTGEPAIDTLDSESSGTRKMIDFYIHLRKILRVGGVLFVDELDAKLHPLLLRYILIMFHDPKKNPYHAQLIFTTQEVFTLSSENFRRDEIWFVDKDGSGNSSLYSLAEYRDEDDKKVRNDASYGKDYIMGRFKAVPTFSDWGGTDG